MGIDFGIVKKYFTDRGFGFVAHTFLATHSTEVFFHIKNIKKSDIDLARRIDNEDTTEAIYFWYEIENSKKGEQVCTVSNPKCIHQKYSGELPDFIEKIVSIWRNISLKTPEWLEQITIDLMGTERTDNLRIERDCLKLERKEKLRETEAIQKIEDAKLLVLKEERKIQQEKLIEEERVQQEIEDNEFEQLIAEMTSLNFTRTEIQSKIETFDYKSLLVEYNLSRAEMVQIKNYMVIYSEHNFKTQNAANNYITENKRWDEFPDIRSLNDHGSYTNIPGIFPKFYRITCEILKITKGNGAPLTKATKY